MAKKISPELKKIGTYLQLDEGTVFTIPEYQRPYSWEIVHCDKLWQDITDYAETGNKDSYFFGTIIINCQENDTKLGLIDGQQRTTTFLLLLKALLVRINAALSDAVVDEDSAALVRGLQARRRRIMRILYKAEDEDISDKPNRLKDAEIGRRSLLLENYSINEQHKTELANILQTTDFEEAKANAKRIKYKQGDNKYTNFFRNYKFFYEKTAELSESNLNKIARTITESCEVIEIKSWDVEQAIKMFNSLNSDGLPLYDSDIISAQLYAEAERLEQKTEYSELWTQLNAHINELSASNIANVNSILMQYMYYLRTANKETVSETGAVNVTTPGLRRYFIEENREPLRNPIKMCQDMLHLVKAWKKVSEFTLVKLLLKFNENSKLFLASFFFRLNEEEISEDDIVPVLLSMLRLFAILELVDTGYSSRYFKTFLFKEEVKLIDQNVSLEEIEDDFNTHIRAEWSKTEIEEKLQGYNGNLLVYLNEYLFAKEEALPFQFSPKYDVEHIMPHSGNNLSEIRKDAGIDDREECESIVNLLGNKIVLEEKINRAIGNEWFRTKVSTKLENKTGYVDSIYPIAHALVETYRGKSKPYWTKEDILSATKLSANRIVKFLFSQE